MIIHKDSNDFMVSALGGEKQGYHYNLVFGNGVSQMISFQYGDVEENGVNGLTDEGLLNILAHRIRSLGHPDDIEISNHALLRLEEVRSWLRKTTISEDQVNLKYREDQDGLLQKTT